MKVAFVFTQAPYGSSRVREGIDALLAMSAYCDETDIGVFFLHDGVLNLLAKQQAELLLQKETSAMLKLLALYEIEQCFISQEDVARYQLTDQSLLLPVKILEQSALINRLRQAEKILTF
ncbi:sulfurtransferase complex subunit TusC [Gallibacterium salpingitidis]|uniref:Sulfur relay protein TusC n=1 Tax=Gallibacterium salpingitidis TaxID=505341 RepID=A0A1A7NQE6_9PAST|nr:sulfurtransferase complex subunit TusC [Gallibacterium salpingitidis]OBW91835.1 sulfur relay protein TusC [Gallibacterium salpingitidis]